MRQLPERLPCRDGYRYNHSMFKGIVSLFLALCGALASAACSIAITSVQMCDGNGVVTPWTYSMPNYGLKVSWTVTGTPTAPYTVQFTMGAVTNTTSATFGGGSEAAVWATSYPSIFPLPVVVKIDPGNVSGNTTPATATKSVTFTPTPPTTPVVYYGAQTLFGRQTVSVPVTAGTVTKLVLTLGQPISSTFQTVSSVSCTQTANAASTPATLVTSLPTHYPVYQAIFANAGPGTYGLTENFQITSHDVACNLGLINTTWAQLDALKGVGTWPGYLGAEPNDEIADPNIVAFTNAALPANYRTVITPLRAAELLFHAVVQAIVYKTPAPAGDASTTLSTKTGDCGGMSELYNTCLRIVGIPSRITCGWAIPGASATHCWSELYLPGPGWVPADTSLSRLFLPNCGTMAYFGYLPGSHNNCSVCRGGLYSTPAMTTDFLQIPAVSISNVNTSPTVGASSNTLALSTTPLP